MTGREATTITTVERPDLAGADSIDAFIARLRELRAAAGVGYRDLHRGVVRLRQTNGVPELPPYSTVYRCLQPGRSRLDIDLVVDIVVALTGDATEAARWRQAYQRIVGEAADAALVSVSDALPDDIDRFVGRSVELDAVQSSLSSGTAPAGGTVVISAIEGMAGVGKTSLAVHAAHQMAEHPQFAEVVLAVNLRGFDAELPPADPSAVLDGFLRRLGVPGEQVQRLDLAARSAKYRELMSQRSALVLLDNAASEDQVRPLLPESSSGVVLVTSRRRLSGLPNARHLHVDVLAPTDVLQELGGAHARSGCAELSLASHRRALEIARAGASRGIEVTALNGIGSALRVMGDIKQALEHHVRAHSIADEIGALRGVAYARDGLGCAYATAGDIDAARSEWERASTMFTELGSPEAADVAARLEALESGEAARNQVTRHPFTAQ